MTQDRKTHILSGPGRTSGSFPRLLVLCAALTVFGGCAYRHYLGIHGPSIKHFPDVHQGVTQDRECLECHDPDRNPTGPPTSHPKFVGCLKCHNDDVRAKRDTDGHGYTRMEKNPEEKKIKLEFGMIEYPKPGLFLYPCLSVSIRV